jgi:Domain of unknown function (DUF4191)
MARKDKDPDKQPSGIGRIRAAYTMTKERDKYVGLICFAWFLGVALIVGGLAYWLFPGISGPITAVVLGVPAGMLAWVIVFGRRAERSAYKQLEGQPGAAAAALGVLRRGWQVQPAIAITKNQDLVHRVVGRPGIILVGEGQSSRVRQLLQVEKKKHARVVGESVPLYDVVVGDGEDEVPIPRLAKHIMKLPKNIHPAEVTDAVQRLKALDAMRPQVPMPKGPMPTTTKQARAAMRGQAPRR